jgi:hypothetical protein
MCKLVVQESELGIFKWMCAQKPPCDFETFLEVTEEGGAVEVYLQMRLDLVRMCGTETEDMAVTERAEAVAVIDQGADMYVKDDGDTPLHDAMAMQWWSRRSWRTAWTYTQGTLMDGHHCTVLV